MKFKLSGAAGGVLHIPMPLTPNFTVTARVSGPLTEDGLRRALERLPERHPLLRSRGSIESDGRAYFIDTDVPPISLQCVDRTNDTHWVEQIKVELERPFRYLEGPLFRLVWLRGSDVSDLILVCDHITSDALAGVYALKTLLELLAEPDRPLELEPPPYLADLLPQSVLDKAAALNAAPPMPPPPDAAGPPPSFSLPPINLIPIELSQSETDTLLARCRAHGVTLQAALSAAFLLPLAEQEPNQPIRKVEVPVNLRNRVAQPIGEAYGVYIALMVVEVDCTPGRDLWEIVKGASNALSQALQEERFYRSPMLIVLVADQFPPENPFATDYDISVSNLGRLDIPADYGPFHIDSIYAPTMLVMGPDHRILGVTTFNGQLRATFITRRADADQYAARAREILSTLLH